MGYELVEDDKQRDLAYCQLISFDQPQQHIERSLKGRQPKLVAFERRGHSRGLLHYLSLRQIEAHGTLMGDEGKPATKLLTGKNPQQQGAYWLSDAADD